MTPRLLSLSDRFSQDNRLFDILRAPPSHYYSGTQRIPVSTYLYVYYTIYIPTTTKAIAGESGPLDEPSLTASNNRATTLPLPPHRARLSPAVVLQGLDFLTVGAPHTGQPRDGRKAVTAFLKRAAGRVKMIC